MVLQRGMKEHEPDLSIYPIQFRVEKLSTYDQLKIGAAKALSYQYVSVTEAGSSKNLYVLREPIS